MSGSGRLTEAALRHRAWVLTVTAALVVLAALGLARLRLDFSSRAFYAADPAQAAALSGLHERWGPDDARLFLVASTAEPEGVLTPTRRQALAKVAQDVRGVDGVAAAWGIADLVPSAVASPALAAAALGETPAVPLLLSRDGQVTAIAVELARSSDDPAAVTEAVEGIRDVVARSSGTADLALSLAGVPVVRAAFHELAIGDQRRLQPIVYAVMAVLLWLGFRRVHGVVVPLVAAGLPVLLLVGAMGWAGEPIGLLNQAYFTLLPVIAVADAVHWVARFHERLREVPGADGPARRDALVEVGGSVGRACGYTALTTAAGFASLLLAGMPILRAFGGWAALGIAFAYVVTIVLVPVLLSLSSADPPPAPAAGRALGRIATFATAHARVVIASSAILALFAGWSASRLVVDNRLGDLLDASHPARIASDRVDANLGGTLSLEIELRGPASVWDDPAAVAALTELERNVAALPGVRAVVGPTSLAAAPGWLRAGVLDPTHADARVRAFVADAGGRAFEALATDVDALLPTVPGVTATVTGTTRMAYTGVNRIAEDLRRSLVGVLAVVSVMLGLLARSVRVALVALPVNALPPLFAVALVGAGGTPIDPLAMVVLAVGLGLAVDDTIHLLLRAREHGGDPVTAMTRAVATTGRATVITSLSLMGGLAVDLFASFPPLRTLGLLGGLTILAALAADLVLLPALMVIIARRR